MSLKEIELRAQKMLTILRLIVNMNRGGDLCDNLMCKEIFTFDDG